MFDKNETTHCLCLRRYWFIEGFKGFLLPLNRAQQHYFPAALGELSKHQIIYNFFLIFRFTFFLHALVQCIDVLLDWPPHSDLVDDVRGFFRGQTVVNILNK